MIRTLFYLTICLILLSCKNNRNEKVDDNNNSSFSNPISNNTDTFQKIEIDNSLEKNSIKVVVDTFRNNTFSDEINNLKESFKNYKVYKITDNIIDDLNGDKINDTAKFVENNDKTLIIIIDGKTRKKTVINTGNIEDNNFSWVYTWGILKDKESFNFPVKNGELMAEEKIKLDNTSIFIRKDDSAGGIITFKNGKYIYLNQSC